VLLDLSPFLVLGHGTAGFGRAEPFTISWTWWIGWLAFLFGVFPLLVAYTVWAERKVAGRFQDRIGPNRVGPLGLLQPIADLLKLITKEDIVPAAADRWVHLLSPVLLLVSVFLAIAVIPFGVASTTKVAPFGLRRPDPALTGTWVYPGLVAVDLPSGLLYVVAVSSLASLGLFLAGWSSRNKYALLGAMRGVAQLVSYEIPQVLALVPVVLWAGSLSLVTIFNRQVEHGWFVLSPPGLIAFLIFLIASFAEVNRAPFDIPEAESEIVAGYHTEYSGMRFGLFFLAEYLGMLVVACLATLLFLGGGTLPFIRWPLGEAPAPLLVTNVVLIAGFALKSAFFIFVMFWVRATLPRVRVDRLMGFAWKFLVPLSLINIVLAAVWYECVYRPIAPRYLLAWSLTTPLTLLSIAGSAWAYWSGTSAEAPEGARQGRTVLDWGTEGSSRGRLP
jgi:NADH-quinone oxidoreductase subunit H